MDSFRRTDSICTPILYCANLKKAPDRAKKADYCKTTEFSENRIFKVKIHAFENQTVEGHKI